MNIFFLHRMFQGTLMLQVGTRFFFCFIFVAVFLMKTHSKFVYQLGKISLNRFCSVGIFRTYNILIIHSESLECKNIGEFSSLINLRIFLLVNA